MKRSRLFAIVGAAVLVASVGVLIAADRLIVGGSAANASGVTESASSTASGTDAALLVDRAVESSAPDPAPLRGVGEDITPASGAEPSWSTAPATWRAADQTDGAWVQLEWAEPTQVSSVRIDGADGATGAFHDGLLTFSDGSNILVTTDSRGNVATSFAPRVVTSAKLQFSTFPADAESVALHAFVIDDSGSEVGPAGSPASSSSSGESAAAIVDGDISAGDVGDLWRPTGDSAASAAWVGHSWETDVSLASVQIAGATSGSDSFPGTLVFSDGSQIIVSGVTSGANPVTTIAFAPRTVSWVRFDMADESAVVGEFLAHGPGTTPAAWPGDESGFSVAPAAYGECTATSPAIGSPQESALALVCPETGAAVRDSAVIVISGPPGEQVTTRAALPPGGGILADVARTTIGEDGRAEITIDLGPFSHGPFAVKMTVPSSPIALYAQLFNEGGVPAESPGFAPEGMTLQFEDEFRDPLSVTHRGDDAQYAATKPSGDGGSEFGSAVFVDPELGLDTLGTFDDYLRIRAEPLVGPDPFDWDREHISGILSSARVGGSGLAVQYGYFEARILAPAGRGTWPAFWMLDTESITKPTEGAGEVDAVELYGHNPLGSCHTLHNWGPNGSDVDGPSCFDVNDATDWALEWHTYGVQIRPDGADYYIDGKLMASKEGLLRDDSAYYFLLNLALGGGWPIALDPTGGEVEMYVDWVRAYS